MRPADQNSSPRTGQAFDLISMAAVAWDFPLIGRTRMLSEAWHRSGQRSIFVEAPHSWRAALKHALHGGPSAEIPIVRPWPIYPARFWHRLSERRVRAALARRAAALRRRLDGLIDWKRSTALVVTPAWLPWLDALPFGRVIYDCIDDLSVHAPGVGLRRMMEGWERELIARVDAAVVTARVLGDQLLKQRPGLRVKTIRNAADVARFQSLAAASPRPADLPAGRRILGFIGALYDWIDFDLIEQTARRTHEWQIVLVGPTDATNRLDRLRSLHNVTWLGPRLPGEVPAYVAAFDVCWAPFRPIAISAAANPVKIYEYLALGKPVLTTAVADTDSFGGLVRVVRNSDDVGAALNEATMEPSGAADERQRFASENDWDARARQYVELIEDLSR